MKKTKHNKNGKLKRILISTILYSLVFVTIFSFLDYYSYYIINLETILIMSLILGIGSSYLNHRFGKGSRIDDIGNKL